MGFKGFINGFGRVVRDTAPLALGVAAGVTPAGRVRNAVQLTRSIMNAIEYAKLSGKKGEDAFEEAMSALSVAAPMIVDELEQVFGVELDETAVERYVRGQVQLTYDLLKSGKGVTAAAGSHLDGDMRMWNPSRSSNGSAAADLAHGMYIPPAPISNAEANKRFDEVAKEFAAIGRSAAAPPTVGAKQALDRLLSKEAAEDFAKIGREELAKQVTKEEQRKIMRSVPAIAAMGLSDKELDKFSDEIEKNRILR